MYFSQRGLQTHANEVVFTDQCSVSSQHDVYVFGNVLHAYC